jgi:hypothetical protein
MALLSRLCPRDGWAKKFVDVMLFFGAAWASRQQSGNGDDMRRYDAPSCLRLGVVSKNIVSQYADDNAAIV